MRGFLHPVFAADRDEDLDEEARLRGIRGVLCLCLVLSKSQPHGLLYLAG